MTFPTKRKDVYRNNSDNNNDDDYDDDDMSA